MTAYVVVQDPVEGVGFQPRGGALDLWHSKAPEIILSGPYETGKTFGALHKLHALLIRYPSAQALMVRKTYASLVAAALETYQRKVLPAPPDDPRCPVSRFGGERPDWFDYPNGSRLRVTGLDKASKALSAEYDFIYVNQAEELTLSDWETLAARATGRAGNAPYTQVIGDCNPDTPYHWIQKRERLHLLESRHKDNPTLWDAEAGQWTEQGETTMEMLQSLTGLRYKRGYQGLWVGAEGQVYEFDPAIHVLDPFDIPAEWPRYHSIDFGYTNPFVCQWWAEDPDGRLYMYREIYHSRRTVRVHAEKINALETDEVIAGSVADHDAEDRATLQENGIYTRAANKSVSTGLEKVAERLKIAGDGKPRLFLIRGATVEIDRDRASTHRPTSTLEEFAGYVYPETRNERAADERPVKVDDHGMDALRYMVMDRDTGLSSYVGFA